MAEPPFGDDTLICTGTDSSVIRRRVSDYFIRPRPRAVSGRECWHRVFEQRDISAGVPNLEAGYWDETLARWRREGLPTSCDTAARVSEFVGLEPWHLAPIRMGLWPPRERAVLEETSSHRIIRDELGIVCEQSKERDGIPHYLRFPVESGEDLEALAPRLAAEVGRFPEGGVWESLVARWQGRDDVVGVHIGSFFGWLRNWMGFENACLAFAQQPDLVRRYGELVEAMVLGVLERALADVQFDYALIWEDMAYKNGPMISPAMFAEFCLPHYRRVTSFVRSRGIETIIVDTDGFAVPLIDHFLAAGVNCLWPLEVSCGTDPVALRETYGSRLRLLGGINKREVMAGREAMKRELRRLQPTVAGGGFIPHIDHKVSPEISFADFRYYLDAKRDILGCV